MRSRTRLGEAHQVLELQIMVQLGGLVRREPFALLASDQVRDSRPGRIRRPEGHKGIGRDTRREEIDDLVVRSYHSHIVAGRGRHNRMQTGQYRETFASSSLPVTR